MLQAQKPKKAAKTAKPGRVSKAKPAAAKAAPAVKGGLAKKRGAKPAPGAGGRVSRPAPASKKIGGARLPRQRNAPSAAAAPARQEKEDRRAPSVAGTKLFVANLHFNVSDEDIKELFETIGPLASHKIHRKGDKTSRGTAEAIFRKRADAERAMNKYNNVQLDGRPMRIELIEKVQTQAAQANGGRTLKSGIKLGGGGRGNQASGAAARRAGPSRRRGGKGRAVAMQE